MQIMTQVKLMKTDSEYEEYIEIHVPVFKKEWKKQDYK
jgi:hypothetical protein